MKRYLISSQKQVARSKTPGARRQKANKPGLTSSYLLLATPFIFLKKIEISGFKSFADKTILKFPSGITAIVGPNGTGKSNIADSIRWVLGEQSKKNLRSQKGEDVIFSGSKVRSRSNMSQVSLHLDNRDRRLNFDFPEVTISRKFYRNKETEYLINKSKVRLQDLSDALTSAGFGQKTYSVISQGRADHMVNTTTQQRKEIFEEASGIKPYQNKLTRASRRLVKTKENLTRTEDLLTEITPRLKSLARQVKRQEKRKELIQKLQIKQQQYFVNSINSAKQTQKDIASKKSNLQALQKNTNYEKQDLERNLKNQEEKIQSLNKLNHQQSQKQITLQQEKTNLIEQQANLKGQISATSSQTLQEELDILQNSLKSNSAELEKTENLLKSANIRLSEQQKALHNLNQEEAGIQTEVRVLEAQINSKSGWNREKINESITTINKQYNKFLETINPNTPFREIKLGAKKIGKKISALASNLNSDDRKKFRELDELLKNRFVVSKQRQTIELGVSGLETSINELGSRRGGLKAHLEKQSQELTKLKNSTSDKKNKKSLNSKLTSTEKKLSLLNTQLNSLEEERLDRQEKLETHQKLLFQLERSLNQANGNLVTVEQKLENLENRLTKTQKKEKTLKAQLEIELKIGFKGIRLKPNNTPTDKLQLNIQRIKKKLEKLGGYDPEIAKEYEQCEKRHSFLISSKKDLRKTLLKLEKIIIRLEKIIKTKFDTNFSKINNNFKKYFRRLFGGGRASLTLAYGKNKECLGIDIQAIPPGKRVKNISVLSGGEKSLVSLALLFAIFRVNPTPFCVLDEVDAALDEANSLRFASILKSLSKKTQFLAITHNRETMRHAKTLYGVTMEKNGVSKIVSLRLTKAREYAKV